jgi:hypothetical protein
MAALTSPRTVPVAAGMAVASARHVRSTRTAWEIELGDQNTLPSSLWPVSLGGKGHRVFALALGNFTL